MICSLVRASETSEIITMEPDVHALYDELHTLLYEKVYYNPLAKGEEKKAKAAIIRLYEHFLKNPDKLPDGYRKYVDADGVERVVCDYIAGMTDTYLISVFEDIYIPKSYK